MAAHAAGRTSRRRFLAQVATTATALAAGGRLADAASATRAAARHRRSSACPSDAWLAGGDSCQC